MSYFCLMIKNAQTLGHNYIHGAGATYI